MQYRNTLVRGYTYIELLIVVALMGSVLAFGSLISLDSLSRSAVTEERTIFVSLLLYGARAHAMANINESSHGVFINNEEHQYELFTGTVYTPNDPGNRIIPFSNTRVSVVHTGNAVIVFEALSGDVIEGAGTVTLSGHNVTQQVHIGDAGQIHW